MKKIINILLSIVIVVGNINILPVFAQDECISLNKKVTAKSNPASEVGVPDGLTDGDTKTTDSAMYYQWNYAPWFCVDLGGLYEVSGIKWLTRYETTTKELEAEIYGAIQSDWSDKELITVTQAGNTVEYTVPQEERKIYRYIIVQRPGKGCGLGGKEFYVYGTDVSEKYDQDKATDEDRQTYWMSGENNAYLQLDLGEEKKIEAVELSARCDIDKEDERANFELWLSNDSEFNNYVVAKCVSLITNQRRTRTGKPYNFNDIYIREIDLPDKYRYVRYVKLSGLATLSEIKVLTAETEAEKTITTVEDFNINSVFTDEAGDKTQKAVTNSNISFKGSITNNSSVDNEIFVIAAAYNEKGTLKSVDIEEKYLENENTYDFSVQLKADNGAVKGYILNKSSIKPLCMSKTADVYSEEMNCIYVSQKNGSDNNSGSVLAPLKTLEKAKEKANEIKGEGDVHIRIKNGKYNVTSPLEITEADSGNENGRIIYEGYGTEETLISAGREINNFIKGTDGIYYAQISKGESIKDLYVNGERRNIASSEIIAAIDEVYDTENGVYGPVVKKSMLRDEIVFTDGMEIYYPSVHWRSYLLKLNAVTDIGENYIFNVKENKAVADRATYNLLEKFDARAFYLRNSKQLLDKCGEWFYDKTEGMLCYKPFETENIEKCTVTVSGTDNIVNLNNAEYISFNGLTFAHTGWADAEENGEMRWQGHNQVLPAEYTMPPSAVYMQYSHNVDITDCIFKNTGAVGLGMNWGVKNCNITGNVFCDIADSAMYIGNYRDIENEKYSKGEYDLVENVNVKNNIITNTGTEYHTSSAVQLYAGRNVNIVHNDISDCPYTAVSAGPLVWGNNLADSDENHEAGMYGFNRISNNYIHETNKFNPDGGAIYTLGHNHGSVISGNYIKNQYMDYGAVYNDRGSSCFEIFDNVTENVPGWLYEWSEETCFIKAYNNYSTTDETYGGLFCTKSDIEDVKIFSPNEMNKEITAITKKAGLESEYKKKIGKYIPSAPKKISPVFDGENNITVQVGENVLLTADFHVNERYFWSVSGENKHNVTFKDTLHGWMNKGRQFEKIYAVFSQPGEYEIICEADDGRGYIYAEKMYVTAE